METHVIPGFPIPVTQSVLDSGLTVITVEMPTSFARAQVVVRAGAMQDGPILGTAHFLEHIVYEGPAREGIHPRLRRFLRHGLKGNAATGVGATYFHVTGLDASVREAIPELLALSFDPSFDEEVIAKECGVIQQEIRQSETGREYPRWRLETLFPNDARLHVSLAGTEGSVQEIRGEHLRAFHRRWYHSANAAVIVTGGIRHGDVLSMVEQCPLPNHAQESVPNPRFYPLVGDFVYEDARTKSGVELFFHAPDDIDDALLLNVGMSLVGHPVLGELRRRLRQSAGETYSVGKLRPDVHVRHSGLHVPCRPASFERVEREMRETLDWLFTGEFPDETWETVMAEASLASLLERETMVQGAADALWNRLRHNWLRGDIVAHRPPEFYEAVRPTDIARVAREYASPNQVGKITVRPPPT